jgi:hypothetical protein
MGQVVARESFHYLTKTGPETIQRGQTLDSKHAAVKANPGRFVPAAEWLDKAASPVPVFHFPVEQATAAPGETRTVTKPPVKKAKKAVKK